MYFVVCEADFNLEIDPYSWVGGTGKCCEVLSDTRVETPLDNPLFVDYILIRIKYFTSLKRDACQHHA